MNETDAQRKTNIHMDTAQNGKKKKKRINDEISGNQQSNGRINGDQNNPAGAAETAANRDSCRPVRGENYFLALLR